VGGGPGTGGGTGGGEGKGKGASVGAGQGIGDGIGMRLADVDEKPRIARQVEPEYPEEARRQGIEGRVVARLLVMTDGSVARLSIVSAKPPRIFDRTVLEAIGKWRFHPARFQGRDVAAWVMLPIRFDLKR
jgi:protein TonB